MLQDLQLGLRLLRRSPGFSLLAVLCLTLGIGATTAVCGWIEGILLRPFPAVADQDRLMAVAGTASRTPGYDDVSWPDFQDLRRQCKLVDAFLVDRIFGTTLAIGDRAERATGSVVSANYFDALGVRPALGRGFAPAEEVGRNAHPVTVIAYRTWKERYGGDPGIVGRTQMIAGQPHTIVGVAPEGFHGTFVGYSFQFWVPLSMQERATGGGYKLEDRGARWIEGFARLKPGVTREQAQAEISAVAQRLAAAYPATDRGRGIRLLPLWQTPFNNAGTLLPTLSMAAAVACVVLLIACANVGNLLLVRSLARRHEMTVRLAIGAGPARLARQLLTEGLILSLLAAGGGLLVAWWCRNLMVLLFPPRPGVVVLLPAEIDWRVLAASAAVCLAATVQCGLAPALQAGRVDLAAAMRAEAGGVLGGSGRAWVRSGLVMVQIALSFSLLVGAGLVVASMRALHDVDPGFSTRGVLATFIDLRSAGYDTPRMRSFEERLLERVQTLSGVESAVFAAFLPVSYRAPSAAAVAVDGYVPAPDESPVAEYGEVGPGYLATMGIPLLAGRDIARADDETAPLVAVVNEAMVAQYWHGQDPVGGRLRLADRTLRVIGVAKTSKVSALREAPKPFFYVPMRQSAEGQILQVRTRLSAATVAPALAREVRALDPSLAPGEVITMREQLDRMSWPQRAAAILLAAFGAVAILLAAVGLYGVMSYTVSQSRRELGLRMALGAGTPDLLRLVLGHALELTAGGLALGAGAALALTRLMGKLLYGTSPLDPRAFAAAAVAMAAVAVAACLLPSWRATRTSPLGVLRE